VASGCHHWKGHPAATTSSLHLWRAGRQQVELSGLVGGFNKNSNSLCLAFRSFLLEFRRVHVIPELSQSIVAALAKTKAIHTHRL